MSQNAFDVGAPIPTVNAAVEGRILSVEDRARGSQRTLAGPAQRFTDSRDKLIDAAKQALLASKITSHAQGLALLRLRRTDAATISIRAASRILARRLHHPRPVAR